MFVTTLRRSTLRAIAFSSTPPPPSPSPPPHVRLTSLKSSKSKAPRFRKYWQSLSSYITSRSRNSDDEHSADSSRSGGGSSLSETHGAVEASLNKVSGPAGERVGELGAAVAAREVAEVYNSFDVTGKARFLGMLASRFGTEKGGVENAIRGWRNGAASQDGPRGPYFEAEQALRDALVPRYHRLFGLLRQQPGGLKFVVDLRRDVRAVLKSDLAESMGDVREDLAALERYMYAMLGSWFSVGFLDLAEITWDTPASTLEKIMNYERVHRMAGWDDLKQRLGPGRRCYAFFHPAMPEEPLIFVEVALLPDMANSIQDVLLDVPTLADEASSSTAIFYSISATQDGLAGIELGNFLIKRVVNSLLTDLPSLSYFATLSPIPGFTSWLKRSAADATLDSLLQSTNHDWSSQSLLSVLGSPDWPSTHGEDPSLRDTLLYLSSVYLTSTRPPRGESGNASPSAIDPVANFHLRNGARVERVNWMGDVSSAGLKASAGLMVNYRYALSHIDANNFAYNEGAITVSPQIYSTLVGDTDDDAREATSPADGEGDEGRSDEGDNKVKGG